MAAVVLSKALMGERGYSAQDYYGYREGTVYRRCDFRRVE
jgi:hypothetical protein